MSKKITRHQVWEVEGNEAVLESETVHANDTIYDNFDDAVEEATISVDDQVDRFVDERCNMRGSPVTTKMDLYYAYSEFVEDNFESSPIYPQLFFTRLQKLYDVEETRKRIDGERVRVFEGIEVKQ